MAFAGTGQHQDTGGKLVHCAPNTTSQLISKSISKDGGRASYRGLLQGRQGRTRSRSPTWSATRCCWTSRAAPTPIPYIEIDEDDVTVGHEASVSKIGEEQLFYLRAAA